MTSQGKQRAGKEAVVLMFKNTMGPETLSSSHFCRAPLGIIEFDVVKGTSVMAGTFGSVP